MHQHVIHIEHINNYQSCYSYAMRLDTTYMHVVPNHLRVEYKSICHQHVMMHEHRTKSTTMHIFT